jgi:hypothetical protein
MGSQSAALLNRSRVVGRRSVRASEFVLRLLPLLVGCAGEEPREAEPSLYVGVLPVRPGLNSDYCPGGFNREPVTFRMDDDNTTHCSFSSGFFGEGSWVAPLSRKPPLQMQPCAPSTWATLHSCRVEVEADDFKPLTVDADDSANFYAVLKFGERCPDGATEVAKRIVNEDTDGDTRVEGAPGAAAPNYSETGVLGNATYLYFCFFRAAASIEQTMTAFPDLTIPYAVFHDFEADQPAWVLEKRWEYSDDENNNNGSTSHSNANAYFLADDEARRQFQQLVENARVADTTNTYFDLARVR